MNRNTTNVPERLITKADLNIGDVLVFRPLEDIKALEKAKCLVYGWDDNMVSLLDKEYTVTQEMLNYSGERIDRVEINGWIYTVGISMLKLKNAPDTTEGEEEEMTEETTPFNPSIQVARMNHDDSIISEMKKLVDKKRLKNLLSIAASQNATRHVVEDHIVNDYLDIWAHAKYEYFLLFGKQLRTETVVEVEMTTEDIKNKLRDLYDEYPMYALVLSQFESTEYRDNQIKFSHSNVERFAKDYKVGMKLSKFIANFIKNPQLDIAVSKVMQDKTAKHRVYVSIDPYDYLTMSLNQHDWDSCHRITDGCYGTGALSYMLDGATMIAYRENGREYDYNYYGFKFKGNSKSWRQCVYFDPETCGIIFGRQYPNAIDAISKGIRIHLEDVVAAYTEAPKNLWRVMSESIDGTYEDESDLHYSDVDNGYPYKFVKLRCVEEEASFYVGYNAPCLICGDSGGIDSGTVCVCCDCQDENDYEDED